MLRKKMIHWKENGNGLASILRKPVVRALGAALAIALVIWMSWIPKTRARGNRIVSAYGKLPLSFEVNRGQSGAETKFLARGGGYTLLLTERGEPVLLLSGKARKPGQASARQPRAHERKPGLREKSEVTALRFSFAGGNPSPQASGEEPLKSYSNYLLGNDPKQWRTHVPHFARVRYREVFPGVDVLYYSKQQQLEYDFIVQPGADPRAIRMAVGGAEKLLLNERGDLVIKSSAGRVVLHQPMAFQEGPSGQRKVECAFVLDKNGEASFALGDYDRTQPLRIDPVLSYSAQIDGEVRALTVDASGNLYITGQTASTNIPATPGAYQSFSGGRDDVFIAKLDPTGTSLLFATYLGGTLNEGASGIVLDSSGNILVAGGTASTNFPTVNAFQTLSGSYDVFLSKLDSTGAQLLYSTYLGGLSYDLASGIALNSSGHALIAGSTDSTNFPTTTGAFQTVPGGGGNSDAFVAKVDTSQSGAAALLYSTYLGGSSGEGAFAIAVDSSGNAYVTGGTNSANFPTASPIQGACASCPGQDDAFVTKLNASGSSLVYSTFLGGSSWDSGFGIAVDSSGNVYVAGGTSSTNFPVTPGAFQTNKNGNNDAFVTKLNAAGSAFVYSTFLGGNDTETAVGLALDASGNVLLTGYTYSTNFPLVNPIQAAAGGGTCYSYYYYSYPCSDAVVPQLNASGSALIFSTYLGSTLTDDFGQGIAVDASGNIYVIGRTISFGGNFPFTPGAVQMSGGAGFAAKISPQAAPGLSFDKNSLSYADQLKGTNSPAQRVLLRNMGSAALNISSIATTGDFAQTNDCGASVPGGGNCSIDVTFTPLGTGLLSGSLVVTSDATGSPHSIALSGTGVSHSIVTLSASIVRFFQVVIGTTTPPETVTLSNTGTEILNLFSISASGEFAQTNNCGASLAPGDSCDILVTFTPLTTGPHKNDTLAITSDGPGSPHTVDLRGHGLLGTITSLAASPNPSNSGQLVTFTATVSPSSVTGTVEFFNGSNSLGAVSLNNGTAIFSTSSLPAGIHSITATYQGGTDIVSSTSSVVSQVVRGSSTTALTSSLNPSVQGQSVIFTATVSPSNATGTVDFLDGSTPIGSATLNANGVATLSTTSLAAGSHSITAVYQGDAAFAASTSSALSQIVKATTTTALTSSANPSSFSQSVTFTAAVTPTTATGTVTFFNGATSLGTGTLNNGTATLTSSTLSVGSHSITASYSGDANSDVSTSVALTQTVNKGATSTAVSSSANPSTFGQSVTFTATLSPTSATGTVTFFNGGTSLGTATLTNGSATLSTSSLTGGAHSITASYAGDANFDVSTSAALTQTVNKASTSTTLAAQPNPSIPGQSVTFTATVTPATASGTVTFMEGSTTLGSGTLSNGSTTYSTTALAAGSHSVTAAYAGDANFAASNSAAVTQNVNQFVMATPTSTATVPRGGTANFTLNINQAAGLAAPITFSCTGLPTGGSCAFNPNSVPPGSGPTTVAVAINVGNSFGSAFPLQLPPWRRNRELFVWAALMLLAVGFAYAHRAKRPRLQSAVASLVLTVILLAASACGGGSNTPPPPVQLQVTVNAVSGSAAASTVFTITVVR